MIAKNWAVVLATLNLPAKTKAPGTIASLFVFNVFNTLCFLRLFGLFKIGALQYNLLIPAAAFLIAFFVIKKALKSFTTKDPGLICLDEVVGMLVTLCLIKINFINILLGLFWFRFFDIAKFFGIKLLEKLPGAWGVLLDDVLAGIYANFAIRLALIVAGQIEQFFA